MKIKPSFNKGLPLTPKVFQIFLTGLPLKTKVPRRFLKMTIIARSKLCELDLHKGTNTWIKGFSKDFQSSTFDVKGFSKDFFRSTFEIKGLSKDFQSSTFEVKGFSKVWLNL